MDNWTITNKYGMVVDQNLQKQERARTRLGLLIAFGIALSLVAIGLTIGLAVGLSVKTESEQPCVGLPYEVILIPVGNLSTPFSKYLIDSSVFSSGSNCQSFCESNNYCVFSVFIRETLECQLFSNKARYFLTHSASACLIRRSGSDLPLYTFDISSVLTRYLSHYWPVIDGNFFDIIGGADAECGPPVSFVPDQYGVEDSAANFNEASCYLPSGRYFDFAEYSISLGGNILFLGEPFGAAYFLYFYNIVYEDAYFFTLGANNFRSNYWRFYIQNVGYLDSTVKIELKKWSRFGLSAKTNGAFFFFNGGFDVYKKANAAKISNVFIQNHFGGIEGEIDEVRFYSKGLTGAQMKADNQIKTFLTRID